MKRMDWAIIVSLMTFGAVAEEPVFMRESYLMLAKVTDRRVDLHAEKPHVTKEKPQLEASDVEHPYGLEYGALFELETSYSEGSSATTLATIELGAGWQATDWLHGDVLFLYEEDATDPMELDQLYVTIGNAAALPLSLQVGLFYAPFGHFDSLFVSDPIVLELAESLEEGATLGFEQGGFDASLTVFDSEVDGASGRNAILAASYGIENEDSSWAFGAAWIYNILDADGLSGVLEEAEYTSAGEIGGFNAWLTAEKGRTTFFAEYVQALDAIEIDGSDTGLKPASLNVELGYHITDAIQVGAKVERSHDVADWFAEQRMGLVCHFALLEHDLYAVGVSLEYMHEKFNGDEETDRVTLQLALEF